MSFNFVIPEMVINNDEWTLSPFRFFRRGFNLGSSGSSPEWKDIILKGNTALTLVNAKANGLNYLKLFGGTEQRNLPKGHTQLEYVYMTSGSYIKIEDLLISAGYKIEYDFQTTTLGSSLRNFLGGRANGVSAGGGVRLSKLASGGSTLDRVVLYGFKSGTEYYAPEQFQPNTRYKYTYNNGVCTLESGGSVVSTQTFTITDNTSTKWGINTYVSGNDYWQTDSADGVYAYSLKVWNEQDELVMDLVPDLTSSNVVCFYDTVTGNIREASGGTFEAGAVTVPTPDEPLSIISNNGAIKYSANIANVNAQTALVGYYISAQGSVLASTSNWMYQDFIPVKPNTTYTLSFSEGIYFVSISEYITANDSGFIRRNAKQSSTSSAPFDVTFITITTGATTNYIRFGSNMYSSTNLTLADVIAVNWMLNQGNAMSYQPYVEGSIYTDGTVETVEVTGKNLFDQATATRYQTSWSNAGSGYWQTVSDSYAVTYGCYVKPNTTYTLSKKGGSRLIITGYTTKTEPSSEQTTPADYKIKTDTTETIDGSYTFTTPVDCTWILFGLRQNNSSFTFPYDVQLELGSTATDYAPYFNGGSATAEMLLKVDNYQDIQSVLDGKVTRNVGVKVLDGTEDWARTDVRTKLVLTDSTTGSADWEPYCTHYQGFLGSASIGNMPDNSCKINVNTNELLIKDTTHNTDLATWKQYLADQYNAGTPVTIVYALETPTTESVESQALTIQAGTNVVEITQASIDNLELEVSYKGTVTP